MTPSSTNSLPGSGTQSGSGSALFSDIPALFVTGTDTGVGKTFVSCSIVAAQVEQGRRVAVYKPVETGCDMQDGRLVGEDCRRLSAAAGGGQPPHEVATYCYTLPAAPMVAAAAAGESIDIARIERDFRTLAADYDFVLVEGAGGLLVPVTDTVSYADLASSLDLPVLTVVGSRLGCLNHALLTFEALEAHGLRSLGYILNALADDNGDDRSTETNRETLARLTSQVELAVMPYVSDGDPDPAEYAALGRMLQRC